MITAGDLPPPPPASKRKALSQRRSTKVPKDSAHRVTKPACTPSTAEVIDTNKRRRRRASNPCVMCRLKRRKCDEELPCQQCIDNCLICTPGSTKTLEYKYLPKGYTKHFKDSQLTLVATILKLYSMVSNGKTWTLDEPNLDKEGRPVIHRLVQKLGCFRSSCDESDIADVVRQLGNQQPQEAEQQSEQEGRCFSYNFDAVFCTVDKAPCTANSEGKHVEIDNDHHVSSMGINGMALHPQNLDENSPAFAALSLPEDTTWIGLPAQSPKPIPLPTWQAQPIQHAQQHQPVDIDSMDQMPPVHMLSHDLIKSDSSSVLNAHLMMSVGDPRT